jgi:hypothetical protein
MKNIEFFEDIFCFCFLAHYYSCPGGWEKYKGSCYMVQNAFLTWSAARESCVDRGGDLVSIVDVAEANFIKSFAHQQQVKKIGRRTLRCDRNHLIFVLHPFRGLV